MIEAGFSQVAQALLWPVLLLVALVFGYAYRGLTRAAPPAAELGEVRSLLPAPAWQARRRSIHRY